MPSKPSHHRHDRRVKRMLSNYGELKEQPLEVNHIKRSDSNGCSQNEVYLMQVFNTCEEVDSNASAKSKTFDFFSDTDGHSDNKKFMISNPIKNDNIEITPTCNYNRNFRSGFIWKWTGFKFLKNITNEKEDDNHPPIFTYWLILLESCIFLFMLYVFGFGKFGFYKTEFSDIVWHQSNSYQLASYFEHPNIWLGPSPSGLIRAGAKFTPCMRFEKNIFKHIEEKKSIENDSGCCIRLDNSGCAQTIQSKCSRKTSQWLNLQASETGTNSVCGQDPKYCSYPSGRNWSKNINEWPICMKNNLTSILTSDYHMKCKILARPCCIGIYGQCMMASKEYCTFVKGTFHSTATLCSQVNCLNDVCGQIPFSKTPNQIYRLFVSIFIHAGILQFLITLFIQYVYMRRLEHVLGLFKIIVLYFVSGLGGNLASSIFLPNTPEIGPFASLFGLLSFLFYEIIINWSNFLYPWRILCKVSSLLLVLFLIGLFLPWVDNFSNIFGFIYGFLILFLIRPGKMPCYKRMCFVVCLVLLTAVLLILFYNSHFIEPVLPYSKYLNCIPINDIWCSSMDITYKEIKTLN